MLPLRFRPKAGTELHFSNSLVPISPIFPLLSIREYPPPRPNGANRSDIRGRITRGAVKVYFQALAVPCSLQEDAHGNQPNGCLGD